VGKWIRASKTERFPLSSAGPRVTGVTLDDLLPEWADFQKQPEPQPTTPPTIPPLTPPSIPAPSDFDISQWTGEWETTYGRVNLELQDGVLRGRIMTKDEYGREREGDRLELRADGAKTKLAGTANYTGFQSQMTLTLSADGNSFTGTNLLRGETKPVAWSGKRRVVSTPSTGTPGTGTPTTPTIPQPPAPTVPVGTPGTSNPGTSTPGTSAPSPANGGTNTGGTPTGGTPSNGNTGGNSGGSTGSFGDFKSVGKFDVKLESIQQTREAHKVEATIAFRNPAKAEQILSANDYAWVIVDTDGVGIGSNPGYLRGTATESTNAALTIAGGATVRIRIVFEVGGGLAPLSKMSVWSWDNRGLWDISSATLPNPVTTTAPNGIKDGRGFEPIGADWDFRFDGWRRGRDGSIEVFATLRNQNKHDNPFNYQTVEVSTQDADGIVQADDNIVYRFGGERPEDIGRTMVIPPNVETKVRYKIPVKRDFVPTKLIFKRGEDKIEVPVTP
jgi:hypothetical protein